MHVLNDLEWKLPAVHDGEKVSAMVYDDLLDLLLVRIDLDGLAYFRSVNVSTGRMLWSTSACSAKVILGHGVQVDGCKKLSNFHEGNSARPVETEMLDSKTGDLIVDGSYDFTNPRLRQTVLDPEDNRMWEIDDHRAILVDEHANLALLRTDAHGSKTTVWSRNEGLSHVVEAAFYETGTAQSQLQSKSILVALTAYGELYGLDAQNNGNVLWSIDVEKTIVSQQETCKEPHHDGGDDASPFSVDKIFLVRGRTRTATIVITDKNGRTGLVAVNPLNGVAHSVAIFEGYKAVLASLKDNTNYTTHPSRGVRAAKSECIYMVDENGHERVHGSDCSDQPKDTSWILAFSKGNYVAGFENQAEVWRFSAPFGGQVIRIAAHHPRYQDASSLLEPSVRVTGSRELLYKYVGADVVLVLSMDNDKAESENAKFGMSATLLNTRTGTVIDVFRHPAATTPVDAIRSDNWFVYTFWNAHIQEQELHVVDLYDSSPRRPWVKHALLAYVEQATLELLPSKMKTFVEKRLHPAKRTTLGTNSVTKCKPDACLENESVCCQSTRQALPKISPVRSSFLLTHKVVSLSVTVTERGITERALLLQLSSGRVVQISRILLDARRPDSETAQAAAELLVPYHPVISLWPSESKDVYAFDGASLRSPPSGGGSLVTAPKSARESTCHLAALGTDILYTTLTPGGKFDAISDDFDYVMVLTTVVILIAAVIVGRNAARRKALADQWA